MVDFAPIPGDVGAVRRSSSNFQTQNQRLLDAAATLRRVADGEMVGESIDAVRVTSADVAVVLDKASRRYRAAAEALSAYAEELDEAQREANQAIAMRSGADVEGARHQVDDLELQYVGAQMLPTNETEVERIEYDLHRARLRLEQEEHELQRATLMYQRAWERFDDAAQAAAAAIYLGNELSRLNDNWADDVRGFLDGLAVVLVDWAEFIADVLDQISLVLALGALALCWSPLGPILAGLALGVGIASAALQVGSAVVGGKSISEIIGTAVLAVVGLVATKILKVAKVLDKVATKLPKTWKPSTRDNAAEYGADSMFEALDQILPIEAEHIDPLIDGLLIGGRTPLAPIRDVRPLAGGEQGIPGMFDHDDIRVPRGMRVTAGASGQL